MREIWFDTTVDGDRLEQDVRSAFPEIQIRRVDKPQYGLDGVRLWHLKLYGDRDALHSALKFAYGRKGVRV